MIFIKLLQLVVVCGPHDNTNVTHVALGGTSVWHACLKAQWLFFAPLTLVLNNTAFCLNIVFCASLTTIDGHVLVQYQYIVL